MTPRDAWGEAWAAVVWRGEGWQRGALCQRGLDYSECPSSHIAQSASWDWWGPLSQMRWSWHPITLTHMQSCSHFNPRSTLLNEAALILVNRTTLILNRGFLSTQNWHSEGHFFPWAIATRMLTGAAHFCFVNFKKVCIDPQTLSYASVSQLCVRLCLSQITLLVSPPCVLTAWPPPVYFRWVNTVWFTQVTSVSGFSFHPSPLLTFVFSV